MKNAKEANKRILFLTFLLNFFSDEKKNISICYYIFVFQITIQNNAKKERDLTSLKTKFFCFLSIKEKLTKDAKRNYRIHN
jgi:hypothetical protein